MKQSLAEAVQVAGVPGSELNTALIGYLVARYQGGRSRVPRAALRLLDALGPRWARDYNFADFLRAVHGS